MRGFFSANNKVGQEFVFQTNSSSGTTFDPVVAMTLSKRASWDLGLSGVNYFAGNSISYTYPNSSLKTVKLRTNRLTDIQSIQMPDDGISGYLDLSELKNCLSFRFHFNSALTGVTMPNTTAFVNDIWFWLCNLIGTLDLSGIPNMGGALFISNNSNLTGLTIPAYSSQVFNMFRINSCNIYGRVDLSGYTNLGGAIGLEGNLNITGVTFPNSSQNISSFTIGNNNFTHDLIISGLTGLGGLIQLDNLKSSNIIFPNSSNNITNFNLTDCNFLSSVNLTSLSGMGGTINLQENTGVTSYNLTETSNSITSLGINQNYSLTNLDLSPLSGMSGTALLSNNTLLNNLILPSVFGGPVTSWQIQDCNLPASGVNYVIYTIDNTGWTGGTLTIQGGGNSAPDGSSGGYNGTASTLSLVAKGWSVTTT